MPGKSEHWREYYGDPDQSEEDPEGRPDPAPGSMGPAPIITDPEDT